MQILGFDHLVLTVRSVQKTVDFYTRVLGMEHREEGGRHELHFGTQKINLHSCPGQFQPAAAQPVAGSADLCLLAKGDLEEIAAHVRQHAKIELGPVPRTGARGPMRSIYIRDPDGNLVEVCVYPD